MSDPDTLHQSRCAHVNERAMLDPSDAFPTETESRPRAYRVQMIAPDQTVISDTPIFADDDSQAAVIAMRLAVGHVVELWDGLRFIEHFAAREA